MYTLQTVNLADLKPHPKNPRKHPDKLIAKLVKSIGEFGFTNPLLLDSDMRILAGHARFKAAQKLGMEIAPAIILPLTGAAADAYVIVDNKLNELSEWDEAVLTDLLQDIDAANFDVELTGFDPDEIDALLSPKGVVQDTFDTEKAKQEIEAQGAVTQREDIWLLGEHRLMCGDSTNAEDFAKLMDGRKAQLCVTSPPYGVGKEYEEKGLEPWFETMRPAIRNICRNAGTVCYNIGDMFTTGSQYIEPTFAYSVQMFSDNGFRPLWVRVWDKKRQALSTNAPYHLASTKPIGDAEYVAAFADGESAEGEETDISEHSFVAAFANNNYKFVKRLSRQERREWGFSSMWRIVSVQGKKGPNEHHAMYPVELPWRCIKMHSDKGGLVLEPFSGSGTTIIAAEQTERVCYAMELSPVYCDLAVRRYMTFIPDAEIYLSRNGELISIHETGIQPGETR